MTTISHSTAGRRRRILRNATALALAGAALGCVAAPLAEAAPTPKARVGVTIVSPAAGAPLASGKVAIDLRERGSVKRLHVRMDGTDITKKLHGTGVLRGAATVKVGRHRLEASWRDGRGTRHLIGRDFIAGRRNPALLKLAARPKQASGLLRLRVKVARGVTNTVVLVNGTRTTLASTAGVPRTVRLELGTRHGVRFGANRVTIEGLRPGRSEYDAEQLTVNVARTRPIGAGVPRITAVAKRPIRLDARTAKAGHPGDQLRYGWRVVSKPKGATVTLKNAASARPTVTADRPGRYQLAVTTTETRKGSTKGKARQVGLATTQVVTMANTVTAVPAAGLWLQGAAPESDNVPFTTGLAAVSIGGHLYTQGDWNGPMLLALDAYTLAPLTDTYDAPNSSLTETIPLQAGGTPDSQILNSLAGLQSHGSDPMIVIISSRLQQYSGNLGTTLIDPANPATYVFGYDPTKADYGLSSGWSADSENVNDTADGQISGWLMQPYLNTGPNSGSPSSVFSFRPGPDVPFDTQAATSPGSNTMQIGGQQVTATLANGATTGFQLVGIDPRAGNNVVMNQAFAQNQTNLLQSAMDSLADLPNATILIQSIGAVQDTNSDWDATGDDITSRLHGIVSGFVGIGQYGQPGSYALVATVGVDASSITAGLSGSTTAEATPVLDSGRVTDHTTKQLTGYLVPTAHGGLAPGPVVSADGTGVGAYGALADAAPTYYDQFPSADEQAALQAMANDPSMQAAFQSTACYPNVTSYTQLTLAQRARASFCDLAVATDPNVTNALYGWENGGTLAGYTGDPATLVSVATELYGEFADVHALNGFSTLQSLITYTKTNVLDPSTNGTDALDPILTALDQPSGHADSTMPDPVAEAATALAFLGAIFPPDLAVIGTFGSIAGMADTIMQDSASSLPQQPQPIQVDPSQLVTTASSQLDQMNATLGFAFDRYVSDPGKLARAYANVYGASITNDPYAAFTANWGQTTDNESEFTSIWTSVVQSQLGAAYVAAAYKVYPVPATIGSTSFSASSGQPGPAQLQCKYITNVSNSPYSGGQWFDAFAPWDHYQTTNILTLWQHTSPETSPLQQVAFAPQDNSAYMMPTTVWNLLTGTGTGQWAIAPAALYLTSGMQVQPAITLAQLASTSNYGCIWQQS